MNKNADENIIVSQKVIKSDDIHEILNDIQVVSPSLKITKPELTVILSATSEIYRLVLSLFENVQTEISRLENGKKIGITIHVKAKETKKADPHISPSPQKIRQKMNHKLKNIKSLFHHFALTFDEDHESVSLTLKKWGDGSGTDDYTYNS